MARLAGARDNASTSKALQVSYLLDHLYRSCKISQRVIRGCIQSCVFDRSVPSHAALWQRLFPGGEMENDENVGIHQYWLRCYSFLSHFSQKRTLCSRLSFEAAEIANLKRTAQAAALDAEISSSSKRQSQENEAPPHVVAGRGERALCSRDVHDGILSALEDDALLDRSASCMATYGTHSPWLLTADAGDDDLLAPHDSDLL